MAYRDMVATVSTDEIIQMSICRLGVGENSRGSALLGQDRVKYFSQRSYLGLHVGLQVGIKQLH